MSVLQCVDVITQTIDHHCLPSTSHSSFIICISRRDRQCCRTSALSAPPSGLTHLQAYTHEARLCGQRRHRRQFGVLIVPNSTLGGAVTEAVLCLAHTWSLRPIMKRLIFDQSLPNMPIAYRARFQPSRIIININTKLYWHERTRT